MGGPDERARDEDLETAGSHIASLLDALGSSGPVARERAEALVSEVTALYGAGLERLLGILTRLGKLDEETLAGLVDDELVAGLLLVHGLHPQDVAARVSSALDSVRPYLGSHGGDVELLDVGVDGVVRLRLLGSCHGCPSSSVTLKLAVEDAVMGAAPEVASIVVEQDEPTSSVIPVEALRLRLDQINGGAGEDEQLAGAWEPVPEFTDLAPGETGGFEVHGQQVLACRTDQDLYAFRAYCPRCLGPMVGAALQRALAAPASGGGLLRCPDCRAHFDVREAGVCLEDRSLHLDPFPLLVRHGVLSLAVPVHAGPAAPAA